MESYYSILERTEIAGLRMSEIRFVEILIDNLPESWDSAKISWRYNTNLVGRVNEVKALIERFYVQEKESYGFGDGKR